MDQCAQCGQQGGADGIRLCSACKAVGYCSRDCQKHHWSSHKTNCGKTVANKSCHDKDPGQPASAKATEKMRSLSGDGGSDSVSLPKCHKCGLQRQEMNRCGSCRGVTYCSRDCQRADWKAHKAVCLAVVKVTRDGDEQPLPGEAARTAQREETDSSPQKESHTSFANKTHLTSSISWEEARSRAATLYPGYRIVDKFWELDKDWMEAVGKKSVVAVVKIASPYAHYIWHGRFLEDAEGNGLFVLLHTPKDPRPHFRYEQLREGSFLCYKHAFLHFFQDKTVGFRIDEAKEVHILEPGKGRKKKQNNAGSTNLCSIKDATKDTPSAPRHSPTSTVPSAPASTPPQWKQARSKAQSMLTGKRVVDSLEDVDHKSLHSCMNLWPVSGPGWSLDDIGKILMDEGEIKETLVLQLQLPLSFSLQHSWIVKDRKGQSAHLKFELPEWPVPYSRFEDMQKGHFLYVSEPHITLQKACYTICAKKASSFGIVRL